MKQPNKLILASGSPRRQQILKEARINFTIQTKPTQEIYPSDLPVSEISEFLANLKATAFQPEIKDQVILSADTIVILDHEVLGKPADYYEAFSVLSKLSGRKHEVITGVCILSNTKKVTFKDITEVSFKSITEEQIDYYIKNFKPYDKAGAYGIQEWIGYIGIEKISGSFYNVMGLPIHKVVDELQAF